MTYRQQVVYGLGGQGVGNAVRALLIANFFVFGLQMLGDRLAGGPAAPGSFSDLFSLAWPGLMSGRIWQPVSYMFLHGGLWHVLLNMLALYVFGRSMETYLGSRRFVILYVVCGVLAGVGWLLTSIGENVSCVGASGAVFGIMGAMAAVYPHQRITLLVMFVLPVTMTMRTLVIVFGAISLYSMFVASGGGIAHAAHLVGGVIGYVYGHQVSRGRGTDPREWFRRGRPGRNPRLRILDAPPGPYREVPPTREEVDAVLDKLGSEGMGSLTRREREVLERASRGDIE